MPRQKQKLFRSRLNGFTLIEMLVVIAIILLLGTLLLAVGSSVHKKSLISSTRNELVALQGLVEQFERETNQFLPLTYYDNTGSSVITHDTGSANPNFVDLLYRYPATREQLIKLAGANLKIANNGNSAILDTFGNPIHFIPRSPPNDPFGGTVATEYLRSSGPDGVTIWTSASAIQNIDDILSSDVPH